MYFKTYMSFFLVILFLKSIKVLKENQKIIPGKKKDTSIKKDTIYEFY